MKKPIPRNITLSILLILILILVILFRNRSSFGKDQISFSTEAEREISRIELSCEEDKLSLEKIGEEWLVNGEYEARKSGIAFLGRILTGIKIKSPVSPDLFDEIIMTKNIEPVRVRIFEKKKLVRSFLVYRTSSNVYGNIMKMSERSKPFIVHLPGFEGDIGSAFTTNELYWLPFTVFRLLPSEIESVKFENLSDTLASFTITRIKDLFTLSIPGDIRTNWDTSRVKRYISYFTLVPFERWAFELGKDEVKKIETGNPIYRIFITRTGGGNLCLTLWEKTDRDTGQRDSDRLWGKTSEREELFIIRYFDIDPLLKKNSYFLTQ